MIAAAAIGIAAPARAQEAGSYVGGLKLVTGAMPLPDFRTGLAPLPEVGRDPAPVLGYSLTLVLPDDAHQFPFSPRPPQFLSEAQSGSPGRRAYLGFNIDLGEPATGLYGVLGLGGSVGATQPSSYQDLATRSESGALLLHGGFELGYRPDAQNSFSLSISRAVPAEGSDRSESGSGVRLRYGLKF